jgi:nitrogenase molybdenum-iron protein alpha/beta subunit
MASLVPEAYMLFVVPPACGRHGALGALMSGCKDKVSYLYLSEEDIVSGSYEHAIPPAVDELLAFLNPKPKILFLFGGCIDDLLCTDHAALLAQLSTLHPDILFRYCHMNPIQLDTPNPPGVTLFTNIYSLLPKKTHDPSQINLLGNNLAPSAHSELYAIAASFGVRITQLPRCKTFEDFMEMGSASLNLVCSPRCVPAAKQMEKRLGIPYLPCFPTYDPLQIASFYQLLTERLASQTGRSSSYDWHTEQRKAEAALRRTAERLQGTPVSVDFQATNRPLSLTRTLLKHGFSIGLVSVDGVPPFEKEAFSWLQEHAPSVEIIDPMHHDAPKNAYPQFHNSISLGVDSAYATGTDHIVDLQEDNDLFGFDGIVRLMEIISKAAMETADIKDKIREAKLVI